MLDGIELHGRMNIVAFGITTEGEKLALGLWAGRPRTRPSLGAAVGPGRPGARRRAGDAVRDRWLKGALNAVANFEFERLMRRPPTISAEKELVVICSTQRTDGSSSRSCGRVCGASEPRGGSGAGGVAGGRGAGVAGGVRPVGTAGATVYQRGAGAARWRAGAGAHGGVHCQVGAIVNRRASYRGGSDRSVVERGDCRGGVCLSCRCWRAGRWPGALRSSSSATGSPARLAQAYRCWRPSGGA